MIYAIANDLYSVLRSFVKYIVLFIVVFSGNKVYAQDSNDQQVWLETSLYHTFPNTIQYGAELNFNRILEKGERWAQYSINNVFTYNIIAQFDILVGLLGSYETPLTDNSQYNMTEIRPWLGLRYHVNPSKRFLVRAYLRLEERFSFYLSDEPNKQSTRLRLRPELIYPLNKKTVFTDKAVWLKLYFEYFWNMSEPPSERYVRNASIQFGGGYRINYNWRFEILFQQQFHRNSIEDPYNGNSQIFYIRIEYHLLPKTNNND